MNKKHENNRLAIFLLDPKYHIWRHLIFILFGAIITFNQVFIAYRDCYAVLGARIYLICLYSFALFLGAMYFNYFYLTPKFLLKGRHIAYSILLFIVVFSLPTLSVAGEYFIRNALGLPHRITSYTNPLILVDNLSTSMITGICLCGISLGTLFRSWLNRNERVKELEGEHLKSELNKVKGQITPAFLSRTLRNSSALTETNPKKTTDILMRLSQLLRYQLYDCNREKILLKSEIGFLNKFLELEQMNNPRFRYHIHAESDIENLLVSPMLFISIIQQAIHESTVIDLYFNLENECLSFSYESDSETELNGDTLLLIQKRLELQYRDNYSLTSDKGIAELKINISE